MPTALPALLHVPHQLQADLGKLTWYETGGQAEVLAHPQDEAQLAALVRALNEAQTPWRMLGSGANLLVCDHVVPGVTIRLDAPAFAQLAMDEATGSVTAGAGFDLMKLIRETTQRGLAGLEGLAGVPASVGGAVRMNAGGKHGEIGAFVASVRVMDHAGSVREIPGADCGFAYRHCAITEPVILGAKFQLAKVDDKKPLIERMKAIYQEKTASQPFNARSAGCTWKNPPKDAPGVGGRPAGMLVDQCGLKGLRKGTAWVSDKHANFILLEREGGRTDDVVAVMAHCEAVVKAQTGVDLAREVVVW